MAFSVSAGEEAAHAVLVGDCAAVLAGLPEKSVDVVFADPPYRLQLRQELYRPNMTRVAGVDDAWDQFADNRAYDEFTAAWLEGCRRVMTDEATIWVIGSYHNIFRVGRIMMDLGFWILNDVQWYKANPMPNFRGVRFTNATETLIWAKKSEGQKRYVFNHHVMKTLNGGKQMTSVWSIPLCTGRERIRGADGKKAHSTQKPEALLRRVILASSREGDRVLDPFAGTGTTGAVAKKLNRRSVCIEREAGYAEICRRRLAGIDAAEFAEWRLVEPERRRAARVSMQALLAANYLRPRQRLYTKNKAESAVVLADGRVRNHVGEGSIHQVGALIRESEACNGWFFWYYEGRQGLVALDERRREYRRRHV